MDLDVRAKMSETLKMIGHQPKVRGGNGKGLTAPQQALSEALNWKTEVAIPTRIPRWNGYPTCYKVDIADPTNRIAIEVDGNSHCAIARKNQDRKKEELLSRLGWTVLRFSNKEVIQNLQDCVQMVLSTTSRLSHSIPTSLMAS